MNKVESVRKLNARELELGIAGTSASWHSQYSKSSVVHIGGLQSNITRESLLGIFEQYGQVFHLHIAMNEKTNQPRGFAFIGYADARSAVLAVDNLNGFEVYGRLMSVDHVADYTYPLDERGESTEHNVRVEATNAAGSKHNMTADEKWTSAEEGLKEREDRIIQRLRDMQRKKAQDERDARKHSDDEGTSKKRTRFSTASRTDGEQQGRPAHRLKVENVMKSKPGIIPGEKEQRRLERAAIREERRRRRAKRIERRATRSNSDT